MRKFINQLKLHQEKLNTQPYKPYIDYPQYSGLDGNPNYKNPSVSN
jgi:hypothetical protein